MAGTVVDGQGIGPATGEWRAYAADNASTKYSPLAQIDKDTVHDLRVVWRQSGMPDVIREVHPDAPRAPSYYQNTPLMVGGLVYMSTALGTVAALDPGTGDVVWFDQLPEGRDRGSASRGVAYWTDGRDQRIIAITGEYLVALNAQTGARYPDFGDGGEVNLTSGYDRSRETPYSWRGPPTVVRDVVVVGSVVRDINNAQMRSTKEADPGDVRGYDVRTGEHLWTFHTVPQPGEFGNDTWLHDSWQYSGHTNVWSWMTADEELGYVYLPLTTPTDDWYGGHRLGDNLFAESLVALDAETGQRVWHFQAVHHGVWDYDFPCAPILADIVVDGRPVKAIAQPSKQAFLYVFDRVTGEPIWPIDERPVPQTTVPGEVTSPTQPVPLNAHGEPFAYDQQGVTVDDLIDFTPELRQEALEILDEYAYGPLFFPPVVPGVGAGVGKKGMIHMPGTTGGTNWNGAALDPETGVLYVPSSRTEVFSRLVKPDADRSNLDYVRYDYEWAAGPRGMPLFKPPYGRIVAIDLNAGLLKWTVPNGDGPRDHPAIRHLDLPPLGNPGRASPLATKTLLFIGEGLDSGTGVPPMGGGKTFRAYDKATGVVVWETELDGGTTGAPMTYMWQGTQYVVVATGWSDRPGELVALALDGAARR